MVSLGPKNYGEEVALFRSQVIGDLVSREFDHGELIEELRRRSQLRLRPPKAKSTRTFSVPTLERWYYQYKKGGLAALVPQPRSDRGRARALSNEERALLADIRREHPGASASLIVKVLEGDGRLAKGLVSPTTVRRLLRELGLDRVSLRNAPGAKARLRWEASHPGALWHADVCHGPALVGGDRKLSLRVHGILDDHSRQVVALEACHTEKEADMLSLLVATIRRYGGRPDALYLDNGSTYSGHVLATFCARLGMSLIHARPYDPQARGKMERFWRTLREGLLDYLDTRLGLADVQHRLDAFLDRDYHRQPHGSLFGKCPADVWSQHVLTPVSEEQLRDALLVHARRRVSRDCVLSIEGRNFEVRQGFLAGRQVDVSYSLIDGVTNAVVDHDGRRFELIPVAPRDNASASRPRIREHEKPATPVRFDPADALLADVAPAGSSTGDLPF